MRAWPVGCGPTLKKIQRFIDCGQPFGLTDEQIREKFYADEEVSSNNPTEDSVKLENEYEEI
jgi:hypothetical protein